MTLLLIFLGLSLGSPAIVVAQTPPVYSTTTAEQIIATYAYKNGIPAGPLVETLRCESSFKASIVGDQGTSFGVAQIHLSAHPDVSKAQALDPLWSIDWAAKQFSEGHADMWSCYKKLFK